MNLRNSKPTNLQRAKDPVVDIPLRQENITEVKKIEPRPEERQFIATMKLLMEQFNEIKTGSPIYRIFTMTQIYNYFNRNIHIMKPHEQLTISVRDKTLSFFEELGHLTFKNGNDENLLACATELSVVMLSVLSKLGRK